MRTVVSKARTQSADKLCFETLTKPFIGGTSLRNVLIQTGLEIRLSLALHAKKSSFPNDPREEIGPGNKIDLTGTASKYRIAATYRPEMLFAFTMDLRLDKPKGSDAPNSLSVHLQIFH